MHFSFIKYLLEAYFLFLIPVPASILMLGVLPRPLTGLNKHEDGKNSIIVKNK